MDITNYIGKAIAYYRNEKDWSTIQLANEADLSQGSISLYENNKRNPSEIAIEKISKALGISVKDLIVKAEEYALDDSIPPAQSDREVPDDFEYERRRQIDRIYRFNDFVFDLSPEVLISFNTRVYDTSTMDEFRNRRRKDRTSVIAHLTEKVLHDFLNDHKDELSFRFEDELKRLNMGVIDLIELLRGKDE